MPKKEEIEYEEYESLKNSKFKQQKLPGWRPVPSMFRAVTVFFTLGIVFAGLGVLILLFSNESVEFTERYDHKCKINEDCKIQLNISQKMKKNISIYYQLDKFYQNHPRYIRSRSEAQLKGEDVKLPDINASKECDPIITNKDVNRKESQLLDREEDLAFPCGLLAKYYFNDTFNFTRLNGTPIKFNEDNIARKSDKKKYKSIYDSKKHWINMSDEHFLVWMRPSPFQNFTKLWGRIEEDLDENITVIIKNNYPVDDFNGSKYIVLKTVNNFGGKNKLLAIGYLIFGGVSIILGIIFIFGFKARAKKEK